MFISSIAKESVSLCMDPRDASDKNRMSESSGCDSAYRNTYRYTPTFQSPHKVYVSPCKDLRDASGKNRMSESLHHCRTVHNTHNRILAYSI